MSNDTAIGHCGQTCVSRHNINTTKCFHLNFNLMLMLKDALRILNNCKLLDLFFFLKLRFNLICVHFHFSSDELDSMSSTERISFLQEKLQEIRKYYMTLKSEVASIDRRRKRLKKKEREGRRACRQTRTPSASFLRRALLHQYRLCLTRSQCCFLSVAISLIARSLKMAVLVFVKEMLS